MTTTHIEVLAANGTQEVKTGQLLAILQDDPGFLILQCHVPGWRVKVDKATGKAISVYGFGTRFTPGKRPALFNI